jgi:hypothetical protein
LPPLSQGLPGKPGQDAQGQAGDQKGASSVGDEGQGHPGHGQEAQGDPDVDGGLQGEVEGEAHGHQALRPLEPQGEVESLEEEEEVEEEDHKPPQPARGVDQAGEDHVVVGLGQVKEGGPGALAQRPRHEDGLLGLEDLVGGLLGAGLPLQVAQKAAEPLGNVGEALQVDPGEGGDDEEPRQGDGDEPPPGHPRQDEEEGPQGEEEEGGGEVGLHQDQAHGAPHQDGRAQNGVVVALAAHEGGQVEDQAQLGQLRGLEGHRA